MVVKMARLANENLKLGQKLKALLWVYEWIFSTKTLLKKFIPTRIFNELVSSGMLESENFDVILSENTKPKKIYVYALTSDGLNFLKKHLPERTKANYLRNNLLVRQSLVHDLHIQAYIVRENLELLQGTTSRNLEAKWRRHTHKSNLNRKNQRWLRWKYDALCQDERLIAVEMERTDKVLAWEQAKNLYQSTHNATKKAKIYKRMVDFRDDLDIFLSKIQDFTSVKDEKLHVLVIICTSAEQVERYKKAIRSQFQYWQFNVEKRQPEKTQNDKATIRLPENIEFVVMPRAALTAIALPAEQRMVNETAYGRIKVQQKNLPQDLASKFARADEAKQKELLREIRDNATKAAVESVTEQIEQRIKAKYHEKLLARNRQINTLKREHEVLEAKINELKQELDELNTQNNTMQIELNEQLRHLKNMSAYISVHNMREDYEDFTKNRGWEQGLHPTLFIKDLVSEK